MFITPSSRKFAFAALLWCATFCQAQPQSDNGSFAEPVTIPTATPGSNSDVKQSIATVTSTPLPDEEALAAKAAMSNVVTPPNESLDRILIKMPGKSYSDTLKVPGYKYESTKWEIKTFEGSLTATANMTKLSARFRGGFQIFVDGVEVWYYSLYTREVDGILPIVLTPGRTHQVKVRYDNDGSGVGGVTLFAHADDASAKLVFPKKAYSIDAVETQAQVSITGGSGSKSVKIELPLGAKLLQPTTNPFSMDDRHNEVYYSSTSFYSWRQEFYSANCRNGAAVIARYRNGTTVIRERFCAAGHRNDSTSFSYC